jgi:putative tryptophan/tyrosine transport system substrate-binding protein
VVVTCDALDSLVVSLARPGGKATGLTCISSDIASKRLQLLKDLLPALAKVAVLYNGAEPGKASEYRQMEPAAAALGLTLRAYPVRTADEMGPAFAAMAADGMQAVAILTDALMVVNEKRLAELAIERKLPSVFGFREYADQGGLMTYGTNLRDTFKRAASYVDKILRGADPASLPVEQPTKFQLVINQRAARALGLTVPPSVLAVADDVLE